MRYWKVAICSFVLVLSLFLFLLWPSDNHKTCWNHGANDGIIVCYTTGTVGLWPFRENICSLRFYVPDGRTIGGKVPCLKSQPPAQGTIRA